MKMMNNSFHESKKIWGFNKVRIVLIEKKRYMEGEKYI